MKVVSGLVVVEGLLMTVVDFRAPRTMSLVSDDLLEDSRRGVFHTVVHRHCEDTGMRIRGWVGEHQQVVG